VILMTASLMTQVIAKRYQSAIKTMNPAVVA